MSVAQVKKSASACVRVRERELEHALGRTGWEPASRMNPTLYSNTENSVGHSVRTLAAHLRMRD
eukprot:1858007-Pleurochrysis_carterae.AAC.1